MRVSVCITVFNEEKTIEALLDSLLKQARKPDKIVIIDGGSTDKTVGIIRHCQEKDGRIKLFVQKSSRAQGRNLAVRMAKSEIIAMTDGGCVADRQWLENITHPFSNPKIEMVAGFYEMVGDTSFQKAAAVYLGVTPRKFNVNFLPSTRSVAFRKTLWKRVGGFPEDLEDTAEDTVFNYRAIKIGAKISRMKKAIVEWGMPETLGQFKSKIYKYAKGDAMTKIWFFPGKGLTSHNIKALFVIFRYLVGFWLFYLSLSNPVILAVLVLLVIFYCLWAFRKVFLETKDVKTGLWGVTIQFLTDLAVMSGFLRGIIDR